MTHIRGNQYIAIQRFCGENTTATNSEELLIAKQRFRNH
jgi:hypothetical protein